MHKELPVDQNIEERSNELINSFRSSFWIDERKWFVRCFTHDQTIHLETLSEITDYVKQKLPDSWKSTYPYDDHHQFYNTIRKFDHYEFFNQPIPSYIRLYNINYLRLKFPINDEFWSIVPNLNKLKSLAISSYDDSFQSQFQTLLDQAPHLTQLSFHQCEPLPLQISLFKYTNASIRQLNLKFYNHQFTEEECMTLSHSSLGVQCEILSIQVKNRQCIIILVKNMINLRALNIKFEHEEDFQEIQWILGDELLIENTSETVEIIQWLKDHLPLTCLISIDPQSVNGIRIWI
ncbi:unnamed protein product [Rotaria sordida]|uniref:Uncharacterized protein n=2 Tax=Rotaria sordida TaxID=392033 RepID=A0A814GJW0_9BILA|nr:unnamed protein product [Rotaria sordida]CAF1046136.1 unnamed protein product [Rotaria sordida]CAF1070738.1 unnamed protein product [Rotaria sordida]CAF1076992.1 unnamed protein product [Rotaria sordida]CAF1253813.1 unnamed protein product [Rotaria sordida]